jgi:hypothetical protein
VPETVRFVVEAPPEAVKRPLVTVEEAVRKPPENVMSPEAVSAS